MTHPFANDPFLNANHPLRKAQRAERLQKQNQVQALRAVQDATPAIRRDLQAALAKRATPSAMGVLAAQKLLVWMEEHIPCLNNRQRVGLVSGSATRSMSGIPALELGDALLAWWCRSEDHDEINLKIELLISQGGLPVSSQELLKQVRNRVDDWRVDQRLPRLREITRSWDQVKAWAAANGAELDLDQAAEVVAERTTALAGLHEALHADEPLVFGRVEAKEARLWLLCCDWVKGGKTSLNVQKAPLLQMERRAARLMDECLRLNVNHPDQIEVEKKRRRGIWEGNENVILQDSRGRWFYGDGSPAIPQPGGGFKRQRSGLGGLFDDVDREAVWSEIGRCFKQQKEKTEQSEANPNSKVDQD